MRELRFPWKYVAAPGNDDLPRILHRTDRANGLRVDLFQAFHFRLQLHRGTGKTIGQALGGAQRPSMHTVSLARRNTSS